VIAGLLLAVPAAVLGLVIGSFLNVVVYRVPAGLSVVRPRSACPGCGHEISARDNVPVLSWLLLRGRCRSCSAPISARYPLVELAGAVAFGAVAFVVAPALLSTGGALMATASGLRLVALLYLAAISIALALIDVDVHRLPDAIVLPSYAVGVVLLGGAALLDGDLVGLARIAAGAGIGFGLYFVLALISPRGMGLGDVKLAGVLGLWLGAFGWPQLVVGIGAAFLLGGIAGIVLLATRRAGRKTGIPFGPWMLAGAWVGIAAGPIIATGYLQAMGLG
jgi:leader peptidase (prepilin peptidase) / N-methyltransferase